MSEVHACAPALAGLPRAPAKVRATPLREGLLDLWLVSIARAPGDLRQHPLGLSADEEARADRFARPDLRDRFRLSRAVARHLIGRRCRLHPGDVRFLAGPHGKPHIADVPDLSFNVSHSQDRILIGLLDGDTGLGVDIEAVRAFPCCMEIAQRVFEPARTAALSRLDGEAREAHFFRHWVEWEARLKARGLGIAAAESAGLLRVADPGLTHGRFDAGSGYEAAWASVAPVTALRMRNCVAALGEGGCTLTFREGAAQQTPLADSAWRLQ